MGLQGGCMCGAVRNALPGHRFYLRLCPRVHCRPARRAPALPWYSVRTAALRWTRGTPARNPSSPGIERLFCANCGTQLTWHSARTPDEIDVTTCSLDDPDALPPADHTFYPQRVRWLHLADALPRYLRTRNEGSGS